MKSLIDKAIHGDMDSDRHLISIFAMALASRGKVFVELGVREGHTTEPLYEAAKLVGAHLWSVDLNDPTKYKPNNGNYTFIKQDSIKFLEQWPKDKKIDVAFVDDWYCLVSKEGTTALRSNISVIPAFSIVSEVTTDTATGTSCNVFSVLVAVTMTSSTFCA